MRALIVEDYGPLGFLLAAISQKIGNQVDVVFSLKDAMEKLLDLPPCDIIFLDLTLIDASPDTAIEAIPLMKERAGKLIIMTGNPKESLAISAMKAGADDYISKNDAMFATLIQSYMSDINFFRPLVSTRGD